MNKEEQRKRDIDFVSRLNGYGSLSSAQTNNLRGINVNLNGTPAPANKDSFGITFFTRPDLNLSYDNLGIDRMLTPLMSEDPRSMARALRCMLDPRREDTGFLSDLFDRDQAFLPLLTNNLINISGWPDITVDTYTSKEGVYKEAYSMIDSTSHIFGTYELTANFRNIQGDPVTLLFAVWLRYASLVYDGSIVPYFDNILENTIDYQTRIYRLVLNSDWTHVQKIAACGAAFPLAVPLGAAFSYSDDSEFNRDNDQISIPFRAIGANYLDPILVKEFNQSVSGRCVGMRDSHRGALMVKIGRFEDYPQGPIGLPLLNLLSHKLYPRIDPFTMELEWYTRAEDYEMAVQELRERGAF